MYIRVSFRSDEPPLPLPPVPAPEDAMCLNAPDERRKADEQNDEERETPAQTQSSREGEEKAACWLSDFPALQYNRNDHLGVFDRSLSLSRFAVLAARRRLSR